VSETRKNGPGAAAAADDVYRGLARKLDAIPNGFPATASGVELQLLARIFSEEEARVAAAMRLGPEPAADIAARAGVGEAAAARTLKLLAKKGLIRWRSSEGRVAFGLRPFVVGIYEAHLPRMDAEFAALFERYLQETRGGAIFGDAPAVHRVIPIEQAIPFEVEIFPYERATGLIEGARSWGVRDCVCRVQQRLIGKGCEHPVENCIMFAPVERAFDGSEATRVITKDEALALLRDAADAGLVHSAANTREGIFYICNCCVCCCGILRGIAEFGHRSALAPSGFLARVDSSACVGCGACVERCQFGALSIVDGVCAVDRSRCVGCGLCVTACEAEALGLDRLEEGELTAPPADEVEWLARRARSRGIALDDIL
jgi:electron transport complex protein RnfB